MNWPGINIERIPEIEISYGFQTSLRFRACYSDRELLS